MNENSSSNSRRHFGSTTYLKAGIFLMPPMAAFCVLAVFIIPKLKQICVDAGFDAHQFFGVLDFVAERGIIMLGGLILVFFLLEWRVENWPKYRAFVIGLVVFVLNSAFVVGVTALLVIMGIAAPGLIRLR